MSQNLIEERALHAHIRRSTVRLLDMTDKRCGGSAIAIQLGKRFFLATAAHVVPESHEIHALVGETYEENIRSFEMRHVHVDDDVALLELSESNARLLKKEFVTRDQLLTKFDQSSRWAATLIGYPGQLIETSSIRRLRVETRSYSFLTRALVTRVIPHKEWPSSSNVYFDRRSPQLESDIFVEFDESSQSHNQDLTKLDGSESPSEIDHVQLWGMSGCGIWLDSYHDQGVWFPIPLLVGIDTGVNTKQRWARGVLIGRWLRLVVEHYPDLAAICADGETGTVPVC